MRDAERRLFRCIGGIDDELILEAATARFQPNLWGHLIALAACLALVLTIPAFLNQNKGGPEAAPGYEQAESPESSNNKFAGAEGGEGIPASEPNYGTAAILKTESIGGLYLGMPEEEITSLLGEAWNDWTEPFTGNDGFPRLRWYFDSGEPNERSDYDLVLEMIDLGSGWHLNHITVNAGCNLPLSRQNISIGSTLDAVTFAYADGGMTDLREGKTANGDTWAYYAVGGNWDPFDSSWSGLLFTLYNDKVTLITYGPLVVDDVADPSLLDALTVNEITIYQWNGKIWETTTVIDKAAKYICTVLTISAPEEASGEKDGVSMWMDFGNGAAVELLGGDRAAVWTYTGDTFDPDKTDGLTYQIGGVFRDLDKYVSEALADPTATWDDDGWDNIIHEGAPESAPEAEP